MGPYDKHYRPIIGCKRSKQSSIKSEASESSTNDHPRGCFGSAWAFATSYANMSWKFGSHEAGYFEENVRCVFICCCRKSDCMMVAWVVHTHLKNLKVGIATFISTSFSPCSGIAWVHRWMAQAHHNSRLHTFGTLWCGSGNKASRTSWSTTIANGRIPILNHHTLYTQWVSSFKPVSEYLRIVVKFDHLSPQVR